MLNPKKSMLILLGMPLLGMPGHAYTVYSTSNAHLTRAHIIPFFTFFFGSNYLNKLYCPWSLTHSLIRNELVLSSNHASSSSGSQMN